MKMMDDATPEKSLNGSRRLKILPTLGGMALVVLAVVFGNKSSSSSTDTFNRSTTTTTTRQLDATEVVRPSVPDPKSIVLLDGRYTTTRDVRSELSLSLDAEDIRKKNATDTVGQMEIYLNGSRSFQTDASGNRVSWSLADLSLDAGIKFAQDPLFLIFRQAFLEVGSHEAHEHFGDFDDHPVDEYANTLVMDLYNIRRGNYVELTAALVLNVWMAVAHELNEVLRACWRGDEGVYMEASVDRAAALWIGNNQEYGDSVGGHMLYRLAEFAGQVFGQDPNSFQGQGKVNENILLHLNEIQTMVKENKCEEGGEDAYLEMRQKVDNLHGYMTVPLVQQLINSIKERMGDWTELYTLSFLPRVAFCDPEAYKQLFSLLVLKDLADDEIQDAYDLIQRVLPCLHITCDMLGTIGPLNNMAPQQGNTTTFISTPCDGEEDELPPKVLAGYQLSSDVNQIAHIDNDILHMRIFMEGEAYDAARDYYLYGQDSRPFDELLSLYDLATSDDRDKAPQFALIADYYEDEDFADETIMMALNREAPFDEASPEQLTEIVIGTLQSMVMHVAVLEHLYIAVDQCKSDTGSDENNDMLYGFDRSEYTDAFVKIWDVGAAFFIGSLEGQKEEGGDIGQLLFAAGADFCEPFGTCANVDYARTNKNVIRALMDGQNALSLDECDSAAKILEQQIVPHLLVPLVQGTLFYAAVNVVFETGTSERVLGAGFAFSRAVLPFIHAVDPAAAQVVDTNLDFQQTALPVQDGVEAVYDAIKKAVNTGEMGIAMPMVLSRNAANITLTDE